ncbi:MAG: phosphohistidine phosphatase [Gammaproteobacteria bacterium]|jgi:phosphohistidine phosphatase
MSKLELAQMQHELVILRHGQAGNNHGGADFDRQLTKAGQLEVHASVSALVHSTATSEPGFPDCVVSSTALRVRQTTELACKILQYTQADVAWEHGIYEASIETLATFCHEYGLTHRRIVMIGHNPGLSLLATSLLAPAHACAAHGLTTAGWAHMAFDDGIAAGTGRLLGQHRPVSAGRP